MPNELLLAFHHLVQVRIKGVLGHIGVNVHFGILVALADDAALPLLKVSGTPRAVQMVQGDEPLLDVSARAHFLGGANQDAHLTGAHFAEQLLLLRFRFGIVDVGNLVGGDAPGKQQVFERVIGIEPAVVLGRGQVAKHHLRGAVHRRALPDGIDVLGAGVYLAGLAGREHRIHHALVQRQLAPIVGDAQHVVHSGVHHLVADFFGALGQRRHHLPLVLRGFEHDIVVVGLGDRQMQHIRRLDVRHFLEHGHQLR